LGDLAGQPAPIGELDFVGGGDGDSERRDDSREYNFLHTSSDTARLSINYNTVQDSLPLLDVARGPLLSFSMPDLRISLHQRQDDRLHEPGVEEHRRGRQDPEERPDAALDRPA